MAYIGRSRAYSTLVADIDRIILNTEARMLAMMRGSIQDAINNAQEVTKRGGKMRIDTGFLRASARAAVGNWPSGPSEKPANAAKNSFSYDGESVTAALAKMQLGDTFYFGWTANYAPYRELYDGFLEGSLQHWSRYVAFNTDKVAQAVK